VFVTAKCAESVHSSLSQAAQCAVKCQSEKGSVACSTVGCCLPHGHPIRFHDPSTTGYNYNSFVSASSGCMRGSWPEPQEKGKHMFTEAIDSRSHYDVSTSHCRKKRELVIGHRERSSLWIWTCLSHNRIAGYHVIKKAEGKRDAVCSLYRYKRDPPKLVMVDFACHAEESGLNWLPEYYKDTKFMHDMFHSYGHVCSSRFSSADLLHKPSANTPIPEQINSYLQPMRGLLASGTTKACNGKEMKINLNLLIMLFYFQVDTMMFWVECFTEVFNYRKWIESRNVNEIVHKFI
jgi:hypothetical protein